MQITWTISLGNILTVLAFVGGIARIEMLLNKFLVEHEILVRDYCERHNIKPDDLPTRSRRPLWHS